MFRNGRYNVCTCGINCYNVEGIPKITAVLILLKSFSEIRNRTNNTMVVPTIKNMQLQILHPHEKIY